MTLACCKGYEKGMFTKTKVLTEGEVYEVEATASGQYGDIRFIVYGDDGKWHSMTQDHFMPVKEYRTYEKLTKSTGTQWTRK